MRQQPYRYELIEALPAAINDRAVMGYLETLPMWEAIL